MSLGIIINLAYYYENAAILAAVEARLGGYVTLIADTADFVSRGEGVSPASVRAEGRRAPHRQRLRARRVHPRARRRACPSSSSTAAWPESGRARPSTTRLGMRMAVDHLVGLGHRGSATSPGRRISIRQPAPDGFRSGIQAAGLRVPHGSSATARSTTRAFSSLRNSCLEERPRSRSRSGARPPLFQRWPQPSPGIRVPEHMSSSPTATRPSPAISSLR